MAKRYIVAVDSTTKEQSDTFIQFIRDCGLGWWHWLTNIWLIIDSNEELSAVKIRNELEKSHPGIDTLVIELNEFGDTWAGIGPNSEDRNMFTWIKKNWKKHK